MPTVGVIGGSALFHECLAWQLREAGISMVDCRAPGGVPRVAVAVWEKPGGPFLPRRIPGTVIIGVGPERFQAEALGAGCEAFLPRPFRLASLASAVRDSVLRQTWERGRPFLPQTA